MAEYLTKQFSEYIPEKDLKDSITSKTPAPSNVTGPLVMDDFVKELMEEQRNFFQLSSDKVFKKIQQKVLTVMGPLGKVWLTLENAMSTKRQKVEITLEDLKEYTEQTVILIGQVYNSMSYQRRLNALSTMMKEAKAKEVLKDKSDMFTSNDELFGEKFKDDWTKTMKSKKKYKELLNQNKPSYAKNPFRGCSPPQPRAGGGRSTFLVRREANHHTK